MPNTENRGGSHEQHVKAGQQSHKNDENRNAPMDNDMNRSAPMNNDASGRGGTHEQHVKAGQQSHKNDR